MQTHAKPLLGVAYLLLVALLIMTSVLVFEKALPWQRGAIVTLRTPAAGLGLNPLSDVKFQGVRIGEVRRITSDGRSAIVHLSLDSKELSLLPANVDAAIVPKTLFGEKYVDLRVPAQASAARMADGGTIQQSSTSAEIGTIFTKLIPILRTLKPELLSATLTSLEEALDGRGATLARDLNQLDQLVDTVDPHLDTFVRDLRLLAKTSDTYATAAPDLRRILKSGSGISRDLLVPKEKSFRHFLNQVSDTSDDAATVVQRNRRDYAALIDTARPVVGLLDQYASALPCLLTGLHTFNILANQSLGARGPFVTLTIETLGVQKPYANPGDLPSNPESDGNNRNLPGAVPSWKPHCPEFAASKLALADVKPHSLPFPSVAGNDR